MKPFFYFLVPVLIASSAFGEDQAADFLASFVAGHYRLIGQAPEGGATYHGRVEITRDGTALEVKRTIAGKTVRGTAAVENAPMAETPVLRLRFKEAGRNYEGTCLINGDLDNHARLTCHLYRKDGNTRQPGLEALFAVAPK